jgi:hypothetical protein
VEGNTVRLRQDLRDTPQFWFYWHFRVRGAAGRTLTFSFTQGNVFGPRGPAVSSDGGAAWEWLGESAVKEDQFQFRFPSGDGDFRFCFAMPYVETNWRQFLRTRLSHPAVQATTLARTEKGRAVEWLEIGPLHGEPDCRILVACRHHACETMASYALEGLLQTVLSDTEEGRWLRRRAQFFIVPFVDKDGVEEGDQGKLRAPHDHWLDYGPESRYASVRALRNKFESGAGGPVHVALDMHCPSIRDTRIYFASGAETASAANTQRFCQFLERLQRGPLVYRRSDNMPFGQGWNTWRTYGERRSFLLWAERLPGNLLAATVEIPYAAVGKEAVTPATAREFGRDLAVATQAFLASLAAEQEKH